MIVGTAGHIDHGKTSLVHALTGVDTDRLKEEKERGMTIELGYAYQPLANAEVLGFIDVPGHERFVHTMLAGAAGIDFALLVIAADDGIMPQTREHLDILAQLGVRHGAVALTKIDRVESTRLAEVEQEIRQLLQAMPSLASAPIFPVNNLSGEGIDALRAHLETAAQSLLRPVQDQGFRLAVDRSFSLKGAGTVVTGTVFAGRIRIGDELVVTPSGKAVRLRSLHVMNQPATEGRAGQRCALNLAGIDKDEVQRGDWVVCPSLHAPTDRFDASLKLSPHASQALRHWTPVHVHLGAARAMGRVVLLQGDSLAPGERTLAQLVLERPLGALYGDVFILRDADARHTIGGGKVLDPWAPQRKRRTPERLAELAALQTERPEIRLGRLLEQSQWGLDLARLGIAWNLPDPARLLPDGVKLVATGSQKLAFSPPHWQALEQSLVDALSDFHARFPDELGPEASRARRMYLAKLPAPAFNALAESMVEHGRVSRTGPYLHLPDHQVTLTAEEESLYQRIRPWLLESPFDPPWVRDLARQSGVDEARMRQLMRKLAGRGMVYQVVRDLYYAPEAIDELATIVVQLEQTGDGASAGAFRDRTGIGRKRCIQILEFFDRVGYTRRLRDTHRLRNRDMFGAHGVAGHA